MQRSLNFFPPTPFARPPTIGATQVCSPRDPSPAPRLSLLALLVFGLIFGNQCRFATLEEYRFGPLKYKGAAVAHVHRRGAGYGSGRTAVLYKNLKKLGYNSVQLNTFAYQAHNQSTELQWNDPTLTAEDLILEIRAAHAADFRVLLKPHIWVGGWDSVGAGQWRANIDFDESEKLDAWFAEYARFILPQARLAEEQGVAAFAVGTELVRLTHPKNESRWRDLIREVRAVYSGEITYACEAWNARKIPFWDAVDAIGLDFYYGYPQKDNTTGKDDSLAFHEPTTEELAAFYRKKLSGHFAHAASLRRPLWLTEVGFPSHDRAIQTPHAWPAPEYAVDAERQKKAYDALRIALSGTNITGREGEANSPGYPQGMWIWKYTTALDNYEQQNYERGFNMQDKPAEQLIQRIFQDAPRESVL